MKALKKIVVIGGGFGGFRAVYKLQDYDYHFEVRLIDKNLYSIEKPALPEVAIEGKSEDEVEIEIPPVLRDANTAWEEAEVVKIDPKNQIVYTNNNKEFEYDYLIVASGAIKAYDEIKGYEEYGYSVCNLKEAKKLYEKLKDFKGGNIVIGAAKSEFDTHENIPNLKAPCEGPVGEVAFMLQYKLNKEKIRNNISIFSPSEILFEDVGEKVREEVGEIFKKRAIEVYANKELVEIKKDSVIFSDGSTLKSDLTIVLPPYKAPEFIANSQLGDKKGFIYTNENMQHHLYKNIYAIGDVNAITQPKLGHLAILQADVAISSILNQEAIVNEPKEYKPEIFCIMNMGGIEATLIFSNVLYGGKYDIAWHSPIAKMMKLSFDTKYNYTQGHMPPDFIDNALEDIIKKLA